MTGRQATAIYEGTIRHRRLLPKIHAFRYRIFMMYVDLEELPEVFDRVPFWSARRPALARFRRSDYLGEANVPLAEAVRDLVEERTGSRPEGPIRLLTHLRYFGVCFNPVSFYYCFDPAGQRVESIVAEIENTPWGERHPYVLDRRDTVARRSNCRPGGPVHRDGGPPANVSGVGGAAPGGPREGGVSPVLRFRFRKRFHVSPFQDMDLDYDWRFREPDDRLAVHMQTFDQGTLAFDATLALRRREASPARLVGLLARYPFLTAGVIGAIYWQALRLKLKGFRFYPHPAKRKSSPEVLSS